MALMHSRRHENDERAVNLFAITGHLPLELTEITGRSHQAAGPRYAGLAGRFKGRLYAGRHRDCSQEAAGSICFLVHPPSLKEQFEVIAA